METPVNVIGASTVSSDLVNNLPHGHPKTHHNNRTSRIKIKMCKVGHFSPCFQIKKNGTLRPQLQNKVTMITTMMGVIIIDDFGVKNDQKVSHNMILMSRYIKGTVTWWKKGQKTQAVPPSPLFEQCPKENGFSYVWCSLNCLYAITIWARLAPAGRYRLCLSLVREALVAWAASTTSSSPGELPVRRTSPLLRHKSWTSENNWWLVKMLVQRMGPSLSYF